MRRKRYDDISFIDKMFTKTTVFCAEGSHPMHITFDKSIRKKIYRCIYYPRCKGMALATSYHVTPGDKATREARYVAHKELEAFFRNKRDEYNWISAFNPKQHIGHMNQREIKVLMQKFYSFKKDELSLYIWKELKGHL